jgi:hypothetical protein
MRTTMILTVRTLLHVVLSLMGIAAEFVVVAGFLPRNAARILWGRELLLPATAEGPIELDEALVFLAAGLREGKLCRK